MTRGVVTLLLLAGLLWASASGVAASELDDHGWWWRAQGVAELPSPPWVPEDGLAVAQDLEGPSAIAAVRYRLGDGGAGTLTLAVASEQGGETAVIRACPARARWRGADAGVWDHRPSADCDAGEVTGTRDEEGETWTFDLGMLADDDEVNVVLLPGEELDSPDEAPVPGLPDGGDADQGPPFQVAFEPPTDDSLEAGLGGFAADDDDDFDATDTATGMDEQESESPTLGASPAPQPPDDGPAGASSTPEVAGPDDAEEEAQPPQQADAPVVADDPGQQPGQEQAAAPASFSEDRTRQLAAAVALLTGLAAVMLWRDPAMAVGRVPGLRRSMVVRPEVAAASAASLAGATGEQTGGLGRFARPREGEPPPL